MDAHKERTTRSSVHEKVIELLRLEAAAIDKASGALSAGTVESAIQILLNCRGKVIVLGIGKSGVIAQKIAQTMTSTGTAAVFIHPSDALHGGLGIIADGDVALAISNSGETEEIVALLPSLKRRNVPLIAIVGKPSSTLARQADSTLDASVDREACPLDLAPTASTTVALAIGDALAMTVMDEKGLTPSDFAANHPAGRLGKRLTVTVGDLMHESPNIKAEAGWLEVVRSLSKHALGAVNVVDDSSVLIGIITDGDLRRTVERTRPEALASACALDMMTAKPVTVTSDLLAYEALRLMEDRPSQIDVLPVIDGTGRAIGMLRLHDVVHCGL
jgi:arabinose-5-phosphate isomerase